MNADLLAFLQEALRATVGPGVQLELTGLDMARVDKLCAVHALLSTRHWLRDNPPPSPTAPLSLALHPEVAFHLAHFPRLRAFLLTSPAPRLRGCPSVLLRELEAAAAGESPREVEARC